MYTWKLTWAGFSGTSAMFPDRQTEATSGSHHVRRPRGERYVRFRDDGRLESNQHCLSGLYVLGPAQLRHTPIRDQR